MEFFCEDHRKILTNTRPSVLFLTRNITYNLHMQFRYQISFEVIVHFQIFQIEFICQLNVTHSIHTHTDSLSAFQCIHETNIESQITDCIQHYSSFDFSEHKSSLIDNHLFLQHFVGHPSNCPSQLRITLLNCCRWKSIWENYYYKQLLQIYVLEAVNMTIVKSHAQKAYAFNIHEFMFL